MSVVADSGRWAPSGPAQLRAVAAIVGVPVLGIVALYAGQVELSDDTTAGDWATGGYWTGGAIALAGQALLLAALVLSWRSHKGGESGVAFVGAVLTWLLSALYIVMPVFAIFAFLASLIASLFVGPAALVLCVVGVVLVLRAQAAGDAPGPGALVVIQTAGWAVALFVMPFAGGALVLAFAGTG